MGRCVWRQRQSDDGGFVTGSAGPKTVSDRSRLPRWAERLARRAINALSISGKVTYADGLRVGLGAHIGSFHGLTIGKHVCIGPRS